MFLYYYVCYDIMHVENFTSNHMVLSTNKSKVTRKYFKIVDAIDILYEDTEAQVITPDGDTEFFRILAGVLQGDTLAPFLFIIALDYALWEATREAHTGFTLTTCQSTRHPATYITDTDFADDIALTTNYLEQAQLLLLRLEVAAEAVK